MQFWIYGLSSIIVFLGLVLGIITAHIAKDELKEGRKYFFFLQNLILALIVGFLLYFYDIYLYFVILGALIVFFLAYFIENPNRSYALYPLFAVFFYISSENNVFFVIESVLILLYGFPTAALLKEAKKKNLQIILRHLTFVAIAALFYLLV